MLKQNAKIPKCLTYFLTYYKGKHGKMSKNVIKGYVKMMCKNVRKSKKLINIS